ncbi:MAG: hypothetical protein HUJ76_11025, partial [Parasporobacterium sp.]|nr:hypothetical protein [Parasporobacterium sp.]
MIFIMAVAVFGCIAVVDAAETQATSSSVLFVGNSYTYYNNLPDMYSKIAYAGTGDNVNCSVAVYPSRTLAAHSAAITAVIRTKGDASKLSEDERKWFTSYKYDDLGIPTSEFSKTVYDNYAAAFLDSDTDKTVNYDTMVLQLYYNHGAGDMSVNEIANSVAAIIRSVNSPKTRYVINVTWGEINNGLDDFAYTQSSLDRCAESARIMLLNDSSLRGKYADIELAYSGRTFCNYLYYAGENTAGER